MDSFSDSLKGRLRQVGYSTAAISAAWPQWWSEDAESSMSAKTELKYTVARRLGISPTSLFEEAPRYLWQDEAKFKNLSTETRTQLEILTSFAVSAGRLFIRATHQNSPEPDTNAEELRQAILNSSETVELTGLLAFCWGFGIPVVKTEIFPLSRKRMHATTIRSGNRHAILLGRDSKHASVTAFTLAHELAHIVLGHLSESAALIELRDPLNSSRRDEEELEADEFALMLLTGANRPIVTADIETFTAGQLAEASLREGPIRHIDPGTLALCVGYTTSRWKEAFGALKIISGEETDLSRAINNLALSQLSWDEISDDTANYAREILGV